MSVPVLIPLPGNGIMATLLARELSARTATLETRKFPDAETYLKLDQEFGGHSAILVCTLDHPDSKFLPLVFAADAARDLGASRVGLVAPYLAYMRQDRRFAPGEAVSSASFARLLSQSFDWLVTIDPHLHRYGSLAELYTIPCKVRHAAPALAEWVGENVVDPVLIGPDAESVQWVSETAARIGAPFTVLGKTRKGDCEVEIRLKDPAVVRAHTPVLIDDIISSGETMLEALHEIRKVTPANPVCLAVHGIFADDSLAVLVREGATIITTNAIPGITSQIDISGLLAGAIGEILQWEN